MEDILIMKDLTETAQKMHLPIPRVTSPTATLMHAMHGTPQPQMRAVVFKVRNEYGVQKAAEQLCGCGAQQGDRDPAKLSAQSGCT